MTREEKAYNLGQEYFPDANNIWARANFEDQWVSDACMKMAEWERQRLVEIYDKTRIFWSDCLDNPYETMINRIAAKIKWRELNKEYLEE